jgi:hypothetical protein
MEEPFQMSVLLAPLRVANKNCIFVKSVTDAAGIYSNIS